MTKNELINIIEKLLQPDGDIAFLDKLSEKELKLLIGYIRERVENSD